MVKHQDSNTSRPQEGGCDKPHFSLSLARLPIFVAIFMDDQDDEFVGRCLIEGFAWRRKVRDPQPWSVRRKLLPYNSVACIGARFRHCSAPAMLMLLANRIELLLDDDDDDNSGNDSSPFVALYVYLRDYSAINRMEPSANQMNAIARTMQVLASLVPEVLERKKNIPSDGFTGIRQNNINGFNHIELKVMIVKSYSDHAIRSPDSRIGNDGVNETVDRAEDVSRDAILIKQESNTALLSDRKDDFVSDEEDDDDVWDDDAGWATVTSLSAPKERDIVFENDRFSVLLNRDVENMSDVHNIHMSSVFPLNDLSSDSDDDSVFEDSNRQFVAEWGTVAFLTEEIPSDPERIFPKQGTEFDKRPLGDLFHENYCNDDSMSTSNHNSEKLIRLSSTPKKRSIQATPLLVKNNQKKYLLFERTASIPKIELSMPYRPWSQIRHELYAKSSMQPFSVGLVSADTDSIQDQWVDMDVDRPPAIISVPMNLEQPLNVTAIVPLSKPSVTNSVQAHRRFKKRSLLEATLSLLRKHIREAVATYPDLKNVASGSAPETVKTSPEAKRHDISISCNLPAVTERRLLPDSVPQQQADVKPVINHSVATTLPQPTAPSTNANERTKTTATSSKSSKPSSSVPNSRLLSANPISIDACLRAGHNYLQLLMTWIQKNYPNITRPSDTIQVEGHPGRFLATFLLQVDSPLKIQASSQATNMKAARHEIARLSVLHIQKKKLGDAAKFNQRRVDSRFDKLAMSAVSSSDDEGSDSGSSMKADRIASTLPVQTSRPEPVTRLLELRPEVQLTQPDPAIRVKQHPDPVLKRPPTPPWRYDFRLQQKPACKRSRNDASLYSFPYQRQPFQQQFLPGLLSSAPVSLASASQPNSIRPPQLESSVNLSQVNSPSPLSFSKHSAHQSLPDLIASTQHNSNHVPQLHPSVNQVIRSSSFASSENSTDLPQPASSIGSPSKIMPSLQAVGPAVSQQSSASSVMASCADKSDIVVQAHLSDADIIRRKSDSEALIPPVLDSAMLEFEARSFLDSLGPASSKLCVAKNPGDPFIIYLDEDSCSDEEFESKQSKLNSIKNELMLLKSKLV